MTTPSSSLWRMADRVSDGTLADSIVHLRAEGASWEHIAQRLHADHHIEVTAVTVADWHRQLTAGSDEQEVSK